MIPTFAAVARKGRLEFIDQTNYNAFVWKLDDGEKINVKISRRRRDRSLNQNSWYWGGILPVIAQETGHSVNELHEIFKRMFLVPKEIDYRGRKYKVPGSTSNLSVQEFTEYVERVRAHAATELNINIPDPE